MALRISDFHQQTVSLVERLHSRLSVPAKGALTQLAYCLPPPVDGCRVGNVIAGAAASVEAYRVTLVKPSAAFLEVAEKIKVLAMETTDFLDRREWPAELVDPLYRSFRRSPSWALMFRICGSDMPEGAVAAVGGELALSMATRKPFNQSFAQHLVEALTGNPAICSDGTPIWRKKALKSLVAANALFECGRNAAHEAAASDGFTLALGRIFRARIALAREKDHQAVLDHRAQSMAQIRQSAAWLRQRVEAGDESAMQMVIGILGLVPMSLVLDMPLLGPWTDDYLMGFDLDEGCLKTTHSLFVSGGAKPHPGRDSAVVPAGEVIVKPFPRFLLAALSKKRDATPQARTVGALLTKASARSRDMTMASSGNDKPRLKATVARFANGLGKFAVNEGIDRYLAALITNDPRVVPTGKFFYAQASRDEIWSATQSLYQALGWGESAAMVSGPAVGSQVTPEETSVSEWAAWLLSTVKTLAPGRRYTFGGLCRHHNAFAMACASIATFFLALRERSPVHLLASDCTGERVSIAVSDKHCGLVAAGHKIPLHPILSEQLSLWLAHCRCLEARLAKLSIAEASPLRQRLRKILAGEKMPMFFAINRRKGVHSITADELAKWWQQELGLEANFARHFWQTALRSTGVSSSDIDAFVRHHQRGSDARSSSSSKVPAIVRQEILDAMDCIVDRLKIQAIPGLVTKVRNHGTPY